MSISDFYKLKQIEVDPSRLMLDPNNPRLSSGWDTSKKYSDKAIRGDKIQDFIYKEVLKGKHRVKKLVKSIAAKGFVRGSQPMIVKPLKGSKSYVVLEGNRRTAAIRYLKGRENELKNGTADSIKKIPVQVFEYKENDSYSESEVVDVLLGTIHIEGPEAWGAMEKAHYIYRSYARELVRKHGETSFVVDTPLCKTVGENFSLKLGGVKKMLGIYRVFQQLKKNKYEVNPDDYSLIEMSITRKIARDDFFRYDTEKLKMPSHGLDRFSCLCLDRDAPVSNPQDFNAFCYVLDNGTDYELSRIVDEGESPKDIKVRTRRRVEKRVFVEKLSSIKEEIEKIKLDDFRDTVEEQRLIKQIEKLVVKKLGALVSKKKARVAVKPR